MLAILMGKKLPKNGGEEDRGEPPSLDDYVKKMKKRVSMEREEDGSDTSSSMEDPVDLFLEAIGVTPSNEARKAFKLAVRTCLEEYESE